MTNFKKFFTLVIVTSLLLLNFEVVNAANPGPTLQVDCGPLIGKYDENGSFALFDPKATIRFYGKKASLTVYYNEGAGQSLSNASVSTIEVTGTSKYLNTIPLNLSYQFLKYNKPATGYYKVTIKAVDSLKKKTSMVCSYEKYYFNLPLSNPYAKGFNKLNCTYDGKKLFGNVYITNSSSFADFTVYVTSISSFADLSVFETSSSNFANSCGLWHITDSSIFADFSIYLTTISSFADFSIYLTSTSSFAGAR